MEKKLYMEPTTRVIVAQAVQLLTASGSNRVHSEEEWGIGYGGEGDGTQGMD